MSELAKGFGDIAKGSGELARSLSELANGSGDIARSSGDFANSSGDSPEGFGDLARSFGDLARDSGDLAGPRGVVTMRPMRVSTLTYGDDFRVRQDGGTWVFEASRTEWPITSIEQHTPSLRWLIVRRWKRPPFLNQLTRAKASAARRYFRVCVHCGETCNLGEMYGHDCCMGCATDVHGVVF